MEVAVGFEPTNNGFANRLKGERQRSPEKSEMALEGSKCPPGPPLSFRQLSPPRSFKTLKRPSGWYTGGTNPGPVGSTV
jgi:hypothetical protein